MPFHFQALRGPVHPRSISIYDSVIVPLVRQRTQTIKALRGVTGRSMRSSLRAGRSILRHRRVFARGIDRLAPKQDDERLQHKTMSSNPPTGRLQEKSKP